MQTSTHPTAERLIETVSKMLDGANPQDIIVDDVLAKSGVSRGSLYHHFGDYQGLIETTLLRRFSVNVDADIDAITKVLESSQSKDDYWARIRKLSAQTQVPARAPIRAERARIMALAASNERFGSALAIEQERLTNKMAETISIAQAKGWVNPQLSARAIVVFIQAYSLGRAVDDIAVTHLTEAEWIAVIDSAITSFATVK